MTIRSIAAVFALAAVMLVVHTHVEARAFDDRAAECRNTRLPAAQAIAACTTLLSRPDISKENTGFLLQKRAWAHKNAKDYKSALADIDRVLELYPGHINSWVLRAFINDAAGNSDIATQDFERAVALNPTGSRRY